MPPSLQTFKARLDELLGSLTEWLATLPNTGGGSLGSLPTQAIVRFDDFLKIIRLVFHEAFHILMILTTQKKICYQFFLDIQYSS